MALFNSGIGAKITLIAVSAATAAIVTVVIAFSLQEWQLFRQAEQIRIDAQSRMLSQHVVTLFQQGHQALINEILNDPLMDSDIQGLGVWGRDGEPITLVNFPERFSSRNYDEKRIREWFTQQSSSAAPHLKIIPLQNQTVNYGTLVVLWNRADAQQHITFMVGYALMALVLAVFITAIISWLVQRIISNRIAQINEISKLVAKTGDYSVRAQITSSDEIGEMALGLNRMLEQIQIRDNNLERQVRQRTKELEDLAEAFRYRALHDPLTGLPNRALLEEEFSRAVAHAKRTGKYFALLLMDIDNFKHINDYYGHEAGDELLKHIASRVVRTLRGEDRVCRLGGDEFVLLIEEIEQLEDVDSIAATLIKDLNTKSFSKLQNVRVGVSIGTSIYPRDGADLAVLKRKADIAMYAAKQAGKNRMQIFQPDMERQALHLAVMQRSLGAAIEQDEFELFFQPQVDVNRKVLVGAESFLRWHNSKYGLLSPHDFLVCAEENGAIKSIDYFVLYKACKQSMYWRERLGLNIPVSVNLSAQHFKHFDIVTKIRKTLQATGLAPQNLTIEISQAIVAGEEPMARKVAAEIRALGVKIALDNFGVGLSSLNNLRTLPVDKLKLDKSFSRFVHTSERERKLAKGIVSLAYEYEVELIAEGVESGSQALMLQELGCSVMQGFWYAHPCDKLGFEKWLSSHEYSQTAAH